MYDIITYTCMYTYIIYEHIEYAHIYVLMHTNPCAHTCIDASMCMHTFICSPIEIRVIMHDTYVHMDIHRYIVKMCATIIL